ncbi:hypothetical protein THIX_10664 [Thiomonas sp. X19]|nr:hypothetical protein THIX_10664 [Thiomonas sp. X19]
MDYSQSYSQHGLTISQTLQAPKMLCPACESTLT